jgi:hypothetical protein
MSACNVVGIEDFETGGGERMKDEKRRGCIEERDDCKVKYGGRHVESNPIVIFSSDELCGRDCPSPCASPAQVNGRI